MTDDTTETSAGATGGAYITRKGISVIGVGGLAALLAGFLLIRGCGSDPMTDGQKKLDLKLKENAYNALGILNSTAKDEKIDHLENYMHRNFKRSLEGVLTSTTEDGEEMHSETREYLTDVIGEVQRAIEHFEEKGKFGYSIVIYGKRKDGKTICFGESADEHVKGDLNIRNLSESEMEDIVGERNYQHLKENTDGGFFPIRVLQTRDGKAVYVVNMNDAMKWTETTDVEAAKELGESCRQLANDLGYLTDNNPETGTFWKLKTRRHGFGADGYKGPEMQLPPSAFQTRNYGARTKGAGNR